MLFGSYRRSDAADPDTYVAAIAAVLAIYDADLIREVTDPRTGVQTTEKFMAFMPNVGELKHHCDAVAARRERLKRLGDLPAPDFRQARLEPPARAPGSIVHVHVAEGHPRYESVVKRAQTEDPKFWRFGKSSDNRPGIWVSYGIWESGGPVKRVGSVATAIARDLAPTPELLKTLGEQQPQPQGEEDAA